MTFTDRQRYAIEHATDRSDGVLRGPPPEASEKHGKWLTILEVGLEPRLPWMWKASISRQRTPGRPYLVGEWKQEWFAEADKLLRGLLKGVGTEDFDMHEHMRKCNLNPDDVLLHIAGYHLWRSMTPDETAALESRELEGT